MWALALGEKLFKLEGNRKKFHLTREKKKYASKQC